MISHTPVPIFSCDCYVQPASQIEETREGFRCPICSDTVRSQLASGRTHTDAKSRKANDSEEREEQEALI